MKPFPLISSVLAVSLAISTPTVVFAHVGHGDEFQATGGTQRVQVNAASDPLLGIVVTPIAPATDGSPAVLIPVTALVDADGKQLVFVQYENFYEPVEVPTRPSQGELVKVTQGLSVGENLVTQGSLSLYAESRKTQPAVDPQTANTHTQADAQGIPHSHDATGDMAQQPGDVAQQPGDVAQQSDAVTQQSDAVTQQSDAVTQQSSGFPMGILAAVGGGAILLIGAIAVMGGRKKKGIFSDKKGGL
ncbi:MAG: cobalt transporter [Cyanobacteria bacterium CAN_BIN43]|nr:cobalt transporter [Cyanobacteria bacterium CAN_BIN43]